HRFIHNLIILSSTVNHLNCILYKMYCNNQNNNNKNNIDELYISDNDLDQYDENSIVSLIYKMEAENQCTSFQPFDNDDSEFNLLTNKIYDELDILYSNTNNNNNNNNYNYTYHDIMSNNNININNNNNNSNNHNNNNNNNNNNK